ncbi:MAG TPA: ferredoxin-thioredoxin reductase catalytic domain-containing protein [Thermoleophilia bacterium]|nr:ferredoxin-thioredoxin reductase catalytic domain-containing protein [Thermoleophilia bacterium]
MTAEDMYERLKKVNEPKGYYFANDHDMVMDLIGGLMTNKERYGYMCCPCRLAAEDREADKDITCPCVYREPDVAEYGSCYCQLYVSKEWNEGLIPHVTVPERRPACKLSY